MSELEQEETAERNEAKPITRTVASIALATLAASVGIVGPADAAVARVNQKVQQLRSASHDSLKGSILNGVVAQASAKQMVDYVESYTESYTQTYTQTYNQTYGQRILLET